MSGPVSSQTGTSAGPLGRGFRLGEYLLLDPLGHGSMATVYLARDQSGHEVAIKVFQEGPGVSPTLLERFKREAEAAKKLRKHPNIMKVYATGHEGTFHYIVMEPVRNSRTLEDLVEKGGLPADRIVQLIIKIARALHFAHTHHVIHRDVKPSNIMIDEFGEPLLADFGVAALVDWPSFTMTGALTGTPLYMSPEQARGERVGTTSDVYSLGVVFFEALTSLLPYSTQHAAPVKAVLEAVKHEAPRRPRSLRRDLSIPLEAVILKALEKDPSKRYADAESFAGDLEQALAGLPVSARPYSAFDRWMQRTAGRETLLVALAVIVIFSAASWAYLQRRIRTEQYRNLISTAHLRNLSIRSVPAMSVDGGRGTPGAWHGIRMGRRAMIEERWSGALKELQTAVNFAEAAGDQRTASIARLEQARCEIMLGNSIKALSLYREILDARDTSPAVIEYAQLECIQQALLEGQQGDALEILNLRPLPATPAIADAVLCLTGERSIELALRAVDTMPNRFQNDLLCAIAVRARLDGKGEESRRQLRRALQSSLPPSEWPGPLARKLYRVVSP